MNKQELIEQVKAEKNIFGNKTKYIEKGAVIELVSKLDEPQKVTVPQFVADWIEYCKNTFLSSALVRSLIVDKVDFYNYVNQEDFSKLKEFLATGNNQEIFARAWLDGYTVEEKRYRVKMKDITISTRYLKHNTQSGNWFLSGHEEALPYRTHHTRKELEQANFGWVFDCEGVEVEEVVE